MLDLFYNGILLSLFALWLLSAQRSRLGRLISFARAHLIELSAVLWTVFLTFAIAYCLFFNQLAQMHDIPNAVNGAVTSEDLGVNPYDHNVVPRFEGRYSPNPSWTFGPYNYLCFDLLAYAGFHALLGFLGSPLWFVVANLLFSAVATAILQKLLKVSWRIYAPLAGTVMLFYSFDNASLTLMLIVASLYLCHRMKANNDSAATIVMGLAVMTKIYAVIPFIVLVLYQLQGWLRTRDWQVFGKVSASVAVSGAIAIVLMLPFGIDDVLNAAVLFHTSVAARVGTSSGGTLLTGFPLTSFEYALISVAFVLVAVLIAFRFKNLNDRMLLVSFVFLLVVVKSSMALLIVPGIFLVLRLKETSAPKQKPGLGVADLSYHSRDSFEEST